MVDVEELEEVMGNAWAFPCLGTWQNGIYSAVSGMHSQRPTWPLDMMTLRGHFGIGILTQGFSSLLSCVEHTIQGPWVGPQRRSPTCLFFIILPIRELCWHKGEVVSVGPAVCCYCRLCLLLPLSRDGVQTRAIALTRWGGRGGGQLFRAGNLAKILNPLGCT